MAHTDSLVIWSLWSGQGNVCGSSAFEFTLDWLHVLAHTHARKPCSLVPVLEPHCSSGASLETLKSLTTLNGTIHSHDRHDRRNLLWQAIKLDNVNVREWEREWQHGQHRQLK